DSEPTRELQAPCEQRRKLVNRRVALTNRITSLLKQYFPQALDWIGDVASIQACDFLESWSTLDAVQAIDQNQLAHFLSASQLPQSRGHLRTPGPDRSRTSSH